MFWGNMIELFSGVEKHSQKGKTMWEVKALKKDRQNTKKMSANSQKLKTPPQTPVRHPARGANLWVKPEHVVAFKAEPKIW